MPSPLEAAIAETKAAAQEHAANPSRGTVQWIEDAVMEEVLWAAQDFMDDLRETGYNGDAI